MNEITNPTNQEFDQAYATEQLRRSRHPLRRFVKGFYLRHLLRDVQGPCIDFGCGAGQLLARLPTGSVGLEVNPYLLQALRAAGLRVREARADMQDFQLIGFPKGTYRTLVIAHVLEHLQDPAAALLTLLAACRKLGVERVIVVVPGAKGYAADRTHKTFIDRAWLDAQVPAQCEGFARRLPTYFPGRWEWIGLYFVFHEMQVVFDQVAERR